MPNQIFLPFIAEHPDASFDEAVFLDLLEHSLSLNFEEKKRIIESIPTLSQFQIDELTKVFEEERTEFVKLYPKEPEQIKELVATAQKQWGDLQEYYEVLEKQRVQKSADDEALAALRSTLGEEN